MDDASHRPHSSSRTPTQERPASNSAGTHSIQKPGSPSTPLVQKHLTAAGLLRENDVPRPASPRGGSVSQTGANGFRAGTAHSSPGQTKRTLDHSASQVQVPEKRQKLDGKTLAANALRASMARSLTAKRHSLGKSVLPNGRKQPYSSASESSPRKPVQASPSINHSGSLGDGKVPATGNHVTSPAATPNSTARPSKAKENGLGSGLKPALPSSAGKGQEPEKDVEWLWTQGISRAAVPRLKQDTFVVGGTADTVTPPGPADRPSSGSSESLVEITDVRPRDVGPTVKKVSSPDEIVHFTMATADRRYSQWIDHKGTIHTSSGALIPVGYEFDKTFTDRSWVCPIRDCRITYKQVQGLGLHFNSIHLGLLLNDNGDGTLTKVGQYSSSRPTKNFSLVVSQDFGADTSKVAPASIPVNSASRKTANTPRKTSHVRQTQSDTGTSSLPAVHTQPQTVSPTIGPQPKKDAKALWQYIRPHLTLHAGEVPSLNYVPELLELPRVRDLSWNTPWVASYPYTDASLIDVTSLLIQLTGVEAPSPCKRCLDGNGLYTQCVMVSDIAPINAQRSILGCASCYYKKKQSLCSHRSMAASRAGLDPTALHQRGARFKRVANLASSAKKSETQRLLPAQQTRSPSPSASESPSSARPPASITLNFKNGNDLLKHLQPFLKHYKKGLPRHTILLELAAMPRLRDVRIRPGLTFDDGDYTNIISLFIQATGDVAEDACQRCRNDEGLFLGPCIVMSAKASPRLSRQEKVCSNCAYADDHKCRAKRKLPASSRPDTANGPQKTTSSVGGDLPSPVADGNTKDKAQTPATKGSNRRSTASMSSPVQTLASSRVRRSVASLPPKLTEGEETEEEEEEETDNTLNIEPDGAAPEPRPRRPTMRQIKRRSTALESNASVVPTPSKGVASHNVTPTVGFLEIEDWEAAPGRLASSKEEEEDRPNTIAVSKAYLTSSVPVQVWQDLAVHVMTIPGATQHVFEVNESRTRVVSLAAGKLKVTIEGEEEFVVGPLGIFRVDRGLRCFVQNRLYVDAVVQVTVLGEH